MKSYRKAIESLFELLELANKADSDKADRWQHPHDASQTDLAFFGELCDAIRCIAGQAIIDHWASTGEVDLRLANRP